MNPIVLPCAMVSALGLAAMVIGLFVLYRAEALVRAAEREKRATHADCETAVRAVREGLEGLASQVRELQQQQPVVVHPGAPKPGLNLTKRSQALRMHRRGEPPAQIASSLDVTLQEVDLLLKVHRIVLSRI